VPVTLDELATGEPLMITREMTVPIAFSLLARPGVTIQDVRRVATHPHAAAQCRRWLATVLPDATVVPALSTAAAAAGLADGTAGHDAAIASPLAAERYRLEVLARDVEDNPEAVTRFVLVSRPGEPPLPSGHDKTSFVAFISDDHPGALLEVLTELAVRGVNLTRIESRPTGEKLGRYSFSIDCEGHVDDARVGEALSGLRRVCPDVRFLGSYPRADHGPAAEASARDAEEKDAVYRDASAWLGRIRQGKV
jgi:prephenate dehydratase